MRSDEFMGPGHQTINQEALDDLFHINSENLNQREIPLIPLYEPEHEENDLNWFLWVIQDSGVQRIKGGAKEGRYFAKQPESNEDVFFDFLHFYTQHASWPDLMGISARIEDDLRNLATSLSKIALYQHLASKQDLDTRRFVVSEIEYIFTLCRSLYDHLQFMAAKSWTHIELNEDRSQEQLPSSFADMTLKGQEPNIVPADDLKEKYGLPSILAEFYEDEAEEFAKLRDIRDKIVHKGETFEFIFETEDGYAVKKDMSPFEDYDIWDDEDILENNLVSIWPFLAHIMLQTVSSMDKFGKILQSQVAFPEEIAPGYKVYMKGSYVQNLAHLENIKEDDIWGEQVVDNIRSHMDD